jgi:carbon-monoxide dehydrogenase medium subunit
VKRNDGQAAPVTLPDFALERPETLAEALQLLDQHGDQAALYMGGTELLLAMKYGLVDVSVLVDGKRVDELAEIETGDGWIRVGAGMTHLQVESEPAVRDFLPELCRLARTVANLRVRATGTLGGNLCFAEPHSDPATLLIALGAEVELASVSGVRRLPLEEFVLGPLQTALGQGEIMTTIHIPLPPPDARIAFERIRLKERPVANVAVAMAGSGARVVVGAVGGGPTRLTDAEDLLLADPEAIEDICSAVYAGVHPYDDQEGSIEYKRHLASVLTRRALLRAFP